MSFLSPTFLYALALIAVPVIIHLFYFRRFRKVYFSNVRFLREVKEETSMRSRLRNLLVLLLRCLAVASLVIAFAQPFLPVTEGVLTGRKAVSVYVDNSFSMGAEGERAPLLQLARDRAADIVEAYGPEDRFQIITNSFSGRSQRLVGQEAALAAIEEIRVGPETRRLSEVLARQTGALEAERLDNQLAYLVSDFQLNANDLGSVDTAVAVNLVPLAAVRQGNVAIDSVWFEAPVAQLNQNNLLLVRVRNYGSEAATSVRLSVTYDGQRKPEGTLSVPATDYVIDSVYLPVNRGGAQSAELNITDYPVTFDDTYFIAFTATERVRVLNIDATGNPGASLTAALGLDVFDPTFVNAQRIDYGKLADYELVILNDLAELPSGLSEQLRQYVSDGGNLLVFPSQSADLTAYNGLLRNLGADELGPFQPQLREASGLNEESFVFQDVFDNRRNVALTLPVTQGNFPLSRYGSRGQEPLLTYRDGGTALARYRVAEGNLYLSAAPLDRQVSDLARNAEVFIPMLYRMGISSGTRRPIAYTIGRDETLRAGRQQTTGEPVYTLSGPAGEFIPEQRVLGNRVALGINGQVTEAGVYTLSLVDEPLESFAFNYDRLESDLQYSSTEALGRITGATVLDAGSQQRLVSDIRERNEGRPLWQYFIWATLVFLLLEVLVLRFWNV